MDQVVCIKNGVWVAGGRVASVFPIKDVIYTVIGIEKDGGETFYALAEMAEDTSWLSDHFRPVKKTDISCFTSRPKTKKREKENA